MPRRPSVIQLEDGNKYVQKQQRQPNIDEDDATRATNQREYEFMRACQCEYVPKVKQQVPGCFYIEYWPDGDLFQALQDTDQLKKWRCKWLLDLFSGVKCIHDRGFAHRDLKPENCLVKKGDPRLCIADFEFATKDDELGHFSGGSPRYAAPEIFQRSRTAKNRAVDMWAVGVILFCVCFQANPWGEAHRGDPLYAAYVRDPSAWWEAVPHRRRTAPWVKEAFLSLCHVSPERRWTAEQALLKIATALV